MIQTAIPNSLQAGLLHMAQHPNVDGYRRQRRMYDSMKFDYYWTHTAKDTYITVDDSPQCVRRGAAIERQHYLTLLPPTSPPQFIDVGTLGSLPW